MKLLPLYYLISTTSKLGPLNSDIFSDKDFQKGLGTTHCGVIIMKWFYRHHHEIIARKLQTNKDRTEILCLAKFI